MTPKTLPCPEAQLRDIAARWPTPFHLYDEKGEHIHRCEMI